LSSRSTSKLLEPTSIIEEKRTNMYGQTEIIK